MSGFPSLLSWRPRAAWRTVLLLVISSLSCGSVAEDRVPEYRIAAGDTIRVTVFGHEDLSGEFEVDGSGRCSLPLIKAVDVAGFTTSELATHIFDQLSPDYLKEPRISVEVIGYRPVYVLGEVRNPGSYPYAAGMTVVNAIALAGGYTYRAARKRIKVTSPDDPERRSRRIREGDPLAPGDVIEIPERFF